MGTYVQISRDELEDWLNSLPLKGKWQVKPGYAGVYLLPLGPDVGIKLSSTIGSRDDAMGKGRASMQLALVSLVTGQVLNKKAQGQKHFKRTTNWKATWKKGFERLRQAYLKAQGFYDALAVIKDRDKYKKDLLAIIDAVPAWENHPILADFHARITKGGILTSKQVGLLRAEAAKASKGGPATAPKGVDDALVGRLRELWKAAQQSGDNWLMDFAKSIGEQVKTGRPLTPRQEAVMDKNLKRHRLAKLIQSRMAAGVGLP